MIIGLGHDIQNITDFLCTSDLMTSGIFFTKQETDYFKSKKHLYQSMAAIFSAKESFYKALPEEISFYWTDIEIKHLKSKKPYLDFFGSMKSYMESKDLNTLLSVSHSGDYASTIVVLFKKRTMSNK